MFCKSALVPGALYEGEDCTWILGGLSHTIRHRILHSKRTATIEWKKKMHRTSWPRATKIPLSAQALSWVLWHYSGLNKLHKPHKLQYAPNNKRAHQPKLVENSGHRTTKPPTARSSVSSLFMLWYLCSHHLMLRVEIKTGGKSKL